MQQGLRPDLRHFYASSLIRSGASVKAIQVRLGHGSAKTTLDVYGHLFADEEDCARQAIDQPLATPELGTPSGRHQTP